MDSYAFPPLAVRVVEVVLVECQRGQGNLRRSVLQVWDKGGALLAEHDRIHADPEYPGHFLRDNLPIGWLEIMGRGGDDAGLHPVPTPQEQAAISPEARQQAQEGTHA